MKTFILFLLTFLIASASFGAAVTNQSGGHCPSGSIEVYNRCIDRSDPNVIEVVAGVSTANTFSTGKYYIGASPTITDASVPIGKKWSLLGIQAQCGLSTSASCVFTMGFSTETAQDGSEPEAIKNVSKNKIKVFILFLR